MFKGVLDTTLSRLYYKIKKTNKILQKKKLFFCEPIIFRVSDAIKRKLALTLLYFSFFPETFSQFMKIKIPNTSLAEKFKNV